MTKIKFICPTCFFVNDLNSRECAQCETPLSHDHEKRYEKGDVIPQYEPDFYRDQGSFKPLKIEIRTSYCRNSKCLSIINEKEAYCKKCGSPIFHHYFSEKYIPKPQLFFQLPNFKMPIVFNIDGEFVFGRSKPNNNYEPMLHLTYVSRKHFVIHQHGKAFFIEDCSSNGTWLNDIKLNPGQRYPINDGDIIKFVNEPAITLQGTLILRAY